MYPRNAASPPAIDLGQILLLSDGTVQTTGVSVRVRIGTGEWGAGAGTLACDTTSGIWTYTPTQAETNDLYFLVAAYKTGCSAQSRCVITSASDTTGYAGLDWSKVRAATTTLNLSGTTIKTATDVKTDTADIQTRLPAALVGGRIDSSVGAYQTGLAPPTAAENGAAGWNRMLVDHTSTGSTGAALGYIVTTVAAILAGVNQLTSRITSTLFSGITRLSHWLGAIAGKTADTATRTEINATTAGASYNETTDSQEAIRDRGDAAWATAASGAVYVLPTKGTQQDRRASTDEIRIYRTEGYTLVRTVTDAAGANVDLSTKTLEMIIEGENRNDKAVIPDVDIDVSGTGNATYTIEIPTTVSAKADKTYNFYLWDKTVSARPKLLDNGKFIITYAGTSGTT